MLTISPLTTVGRTVADGVTTNGSPIVTSATAAFTAADIGRSITGAGIPAGSYIFSLNSATSVNISQNATASAGSVSITIGPAALEPAGVAGTVLIVKSPDGRAVSASVLGPISLVGAVGQVTWSLVGGDLLGLQLILDANGWIKGNPFPNALGTTKIRVRATDSNTPLAQFAEADLKVVCA